MYTEEDMDRALADNENKTVDKINNEHEAEFRRRLKN